MMTGTTPGRVTADRRDMTIFGRDGELHRYAPCATIQEDESGPFAFYLSLEERPSFLSDGLLAFDDISPGLTVWHVPTNYAARLRPSDIGTLVCSFWRVENADVNGVEFEHWSDETFLLAPKAVRDTTSTWLHENWSLFESLAAARAAAEAVLKGDGSWTAYAISKVVQVPEGRALQRLESGQLEDIHPVERAFQSNVPNQSCA